MSITSAMSDERGGFALDLVAARALQQARGVEAEGQVGDHSVVRAHKADLARFQAGDVVDDAQDDVPLGGVSTIGRVPTLGKRLDVRLDVVDPGTARAIAAST
jgi:hypothetical protein